MKPFEFINFKVFILDELKAKKYAKYESYQATVNEFLDRYFGHISENTPYSIFNAVFISTKESKLEFDMELIAESSDQRKGFIKPNFTQINYSVDNQTKVHNDNK
jgi:hypothetical protein